MKIHLLGNTGYIGSWIERYFSNKGYQVQVLKTDVTDEVQVRDALADVHNSVVINATGKTGNPNVDWCEDHRLETAKVNISGAISVAELASSQGNYVLQVGSGCIFSGGAGQVFTEGDEPNFFGRFYSQTKAVAEGALKEIPNVCVLRIRMPLQGSSHSKNLLNKLLRYDKILNLPNSVTVIEDFMPFLERVIERRPVGILNAVNPGVYQHRDLLERYRQHIDPSKIFHYIGMEEFSGMTKAARSNCVLSTALAEKLVIAMPAISDSLPQLIESYRMSLDTR